MDGTKDNVKVEGRPTEEDCFVEFQFQVPEGTDVVNYNYLDDLANYFHREHQEEPQSVSIDDNAGPSSGTHSRSRYRLARTGSDAGDQNGVDNYVTVTIETSGNEETKISNAARPRSNCSTSTPKRPKPEVKQQLGSESKEGKGRKRNGNPSSGPRPQQQQIVPRSKQKGNKRSRSGRIEFRKAPKVEVLQLGTPSEDSNDNGITLDRSEQGHFAYRKELEFPSMPSLSFDNYILPTLPTDENKEKEATHQPIEANDQKILPDTTITEYELQHDVAPCLSAYAQAAGLQHFLKSPKTYRWMCYEFFYSNMDRALYLSSNDFEECLNEYLPYLKTRNLRRPEWAMIRRTLGRPRRLSANFFWKERISFYSDRERIRNVQKREWNSSSSFQNLPDEIPRHFIVGARVTALVQDSIRLSLYQGTIDGLDLAKNLYRITFDNKALGTRSVMDYDILSDEPPQTISTSSISMQIVPNSEPTGRIKGRMLKNYTSKVDSSLLPANGYLGGFRVRFLEYVVRLRKFLLVKSKILQHFKELNAEAEKTCISGKGYPKDFVAKYATCIVFSDCLNTQISNCLEAVDLECQMLSTDKDIHFLKCINPQQILSNSEKLGELLVATSNRQGEAMKVKNGKILDVITHLASLMGQLNKLSKDPNVWYSCDVQSTKEALGKIKNMLRGKNIGCFENRVEIPVNRITAGIVYNSIGKQKLTFV